MLHDKKAIKPIAFEDVPPGATFSTDVHRAEELRYRKLFRTVGGKNAYNAHGHIHYFVHFEPDEKVYL